MLDNLSREGVSLCTDNMVTLSGIGMNLLIRRQLDGGIGRLVNSYWSA
jgi:hypothetical protein